MKLGFFLALMAMFVVSVYSSESEEKAPIAAEVTFNRPIPGCLRDSKKSDSCVIIHDTGTTISKPKIITTEEISEPNWTLNLAVAFTLVGYYGHIRLLHKYLSWKHVATSANQFLFELAASDILFLLKILPSLINSTVLEKPGSKFASLMETVSGTSYAWFALAIAREKNKRKSHWTNVIEQIKWPTVCRINRLIWFLSWFYAVIPLLIETSLYHRIGTIGQIVPLTIAIVTCLKNGFKNCRDVESPVPDEEPVWTITCDPNCPARRETDAKKKLLLGVIVIFRGIVTILRLIVVGYENSELLTDWLGLLQVVAVAATPFVLINYLKQFRTYIV